MKKLFSSIPFLLIVSLIATLFAGCSKDNKEFAIVEANSELTRLNCCNIGFPKLGSEFVYKIKVQLPDGIQIQNVFCEWSAFNVTGNTGTYSDNDFTVSNNTVNSYSYWVFGPDDYIVNNVTIITSDNQSKTVSITINKPAGAN